MHESTCYILDNIEKSVEILDAMRDMNNEVLQQFDNAIRENLSEWFGDKWCVHEDTMHDSWSIHIYRQELEYKTERSEIGAKAYICLFLEGDDPIWKFLGQKSRHYDLDKVSVQLYMDDSVSDLLADEVFTNPNIKIELDSLEHSNYRIKGRKKKTIEKAISFKSDAILKGINEDDWEDALSPLKDAWGELVNLNWNEIIRIISRKKESDELHDFER